MCCGGKRSIQRPVRVMQLRTDYYHLMERYYNKTKEHMRLKLQRLQNGAK